MAVCLAGGATDAAEAAKPDKNAPDPYYDIDPQDAALNQHYEQPYRPQFHYTPMQGIIGDATGLIFYQGEYHLFYMSDKWERRKNRHKCWGHALSRDLLHWEEMPSILDATLDNHPGSGSGIVDWNNTLGLQKGDQKTLAVFYTDYVKGSCIAYSTDAGRTWTRHPRNPALAGVKDIRDPYVFWHAPAGEWRMVRYENKGFAFHGSTNLLDWQPLSRIENFYECPDLFELPAPGGERKWVLMDAEGAYHLGAFDGRQFVPETKKLRTEHGKAFYAQQTWKVPAAEGARVIQMAFLRYPKEPRLTWFDQMSFPCELTLRQTADGLRVCREPIAALATLQTNRQTMRDLTIGPGQNPLAGLRGDTLDLRLEAEFAGASSFTLNVRGEAIRYAAHDHHLNVSNLTAMVHPATARVQLQVLVDRSSLEVFADHGGASISKTVFYPATNQTYSLTVPDGSMRIVSLEVNHLKSVWPKLPVPAVPLKPAAAPTPRASGQPDILFADFEGADYGAWKAEGAAFGDGPAHGALPDQRPITGFVGNGFVNSKHGGDKTTGRLTSPEFVISRDYVTFLIGGGGWTNQTCLNLLIDGKPVRTATGGHTKPGGSMALAPRGWDVRDLRGQTASLEILDLANGGWGHVTVDQILFTDTAP